MKKIIAIVLLVAGLGLIGLAGYGFLFNEERPRCFREQAEATAKLKEALAAEGTIKGAALLKEAREMSDSAEQLCRYARQTQQNMTLMGLGGLASTLVSVVLLVISRKRTPRLGDAVFTEGS